MKGFLINLKASHLKAKFLYEKYAWLTCPKYIEAKKFWK